MNVRRPAGPLQQPGATSPEHDSLILEALPLAIRLAVQGWQIFAPYKSLMRFAAMFALMAAGGTSMMLMMSDKLQPPVSTQPTVRSAESTVTAESSPPSADFNATTEPAAPPDASTTLVAPTAVGPAASVKGINTDLRPSLAVDSPAAAPATAHVAAPVAPTEAPVAARVASAKPPIAVPVASVGASAAAPYPTTLFPAPKLPGINQAPVPRVRTTDQAPAIARLRGDIQESPPR